MTRRYEVSHALSRCTITCNVPYWSGGSTKLSWSNEDPIVAAREEERVAARLRALTPAFEVVLDEVESREVPLQREPIAGVAEIVRDSRSAGGHLTLSVRASCVDRERGLVVVNELTRRFEALLTPTPRGSRPTDDDFLTALERVTEQQKREPHNLQLARWLDLAQNMASQSLTFHRPCAVCGANALERSEEWTDDDWHAAYRDALSTICLEAPHVVTISEN